MKNRKGFTMIELLAVIVILGVLSTIAVGGVSSVLSNAKKEYYSSQENNLLLAAQSYGQNNRNVLPKGIGQMKKITLEELKNNNYLTEDLKSYSKKQCDMKNSYVQIFKYSQKDYSYLTFLDCSPEYTSKEKVKGKTPTISTPEFSDDSEDLRNAYVKVNITGNDKVLGYSYILSYKSLQDGAKWREVKNSGSLDGNLKNKVSFTIKLKDYVPGTVRLEVSATNNYGQTASITASKKYNDTLGPDCIYLNEKDLYDEDDKDHYPWITQKGVNRKMKVQCDDKNGVGCAKEEYTKTFKEDADMGIITIKDKLGNETKCKMSVYIDRTAPELTIKAYKRSASGGKEKNAVLEASVTVNDSKRTATLNKYQNSVNDWLNKDKFPNGIYYEVSYKDGSRLHTRNWTQNTKGLKKDDLDVNTLNKKDDVLIKGKSGTDDTYLSDEGYRIGKYTVSDEAGNTVTINITAPIDRTEPKNLKVTNPSNGNWVRSPFSLTLESNDTMSGLNHFDYQYKNTNGKWNPYPNSNKSPFVTPKIDKDMNQKIFIRVCDIAENCTANSSAESTTIKLDQKAPTCKTTTNHADWTNQKVTLTGTCDDETSGCVKTTITKTFEEEMNVGQSPGSVADQAGNVTPCPTKTVKIDTTAPDCKNSGEDPNWRNTPLKITGKCVDKGKIQSACVSNAEKTYNKNINSTTESPGEVRDYAGNVTKCLNDQTVKLDFDAPRCDGSYNSKTNWTGDWTVTSYCADSYSGCKQREYPKKFTTTTKVGSIDIYDKANNKTSCSVNAYVDKDAPTCGTISNAGSSSNWKRSRTVSIACTSSNDKESGCKQSSFSKGFGSGYDGKSSRTGTITVEDKIGNKQDCSVNTYVDVDPPSTPSVSLYRWSGSTNPTSSRGLSGYTEGSWLSGKVFTEPSSSDSYSGIEGYYFTTTGATESLTDSKQGYRNIVAEGTSKIKWKACDKAGNCSSYSSNKTIKLDRTPPSTPVVDWGISRNIYGTKYHDYEQRGVRCYQDGKCSVSSSGASAGKKETKRINCHYIKKYACGDPAPESTDSLSGVKGVYLESENGSSCRNGVDSTPSDTVRVYYAVDNAGNESTNKLYNDELMNHGWSVCLKNYYKVVGSGTKVGLWTLKSGCPPKNTEWGSLCYTGS